MVIQPSFPSLIMSSASSQPSTLNISDTAIGANQVLASTTDVEAQLVRALAGDLNQKDVLQVESA